MRVFLIPVIFPYNLIGKLENVYLSHTMFTIKSDNFSMIPESIIEGPHTLSAPRIEDRRSLHCPYSECSTMYTRGRLKGYSWSIFNSTFALKSFYITRSWIEMENTLNVIPNELRTNSSKNIFPCFSKRNWVSRKVLSYLRILLLLI